MDSLQAAGSAGFAKLQIQGQDKWEKPGAGASAGLQILWCL